MSLNVKKDVTITEGDYEFDIDFSDYSTEELAESIGVDLSYEAIGRLVRLLDKNSSDWDLTDELIHYFKTQELESPTYKDRYPEKKKVSDPAPDASPSDDKDPPSEQRDYSEDVLVNALKHIWAMGCCDIKDGRDCLEREDDSDGCSSCTAARALEMVGVLDKDTKGRAS